MQSAGFFEKMVFTNYIVSQSTNHILAKFYVFIDSASKYDPCK